MIVGLGGFLAVVRLFGLVCSLTPHRRAARITLLSWLATNAFVGSQLSFLLRPFFGSPGLKVEFLRPDPFNGTFYEAVWNALSRILAPETGSHSTPHCLSPRKQNSYHNSQTTKPILQ